MEEEDNATSERDPIHLGESFVSSQCAGPCHTRQDSIHDESAKFVEYGCNVCKKHYYIDGPSQVVLIYIGTTCHTNVEI